MYICKHNIEIGDYVEVQYTSGRKFKNAIIKGKIVELWDDNFKQAQLSNGWCFHNEDRILTYIPKEIKEGMK